MYYGYGTQSRVNGQWQNFQIIRSSDLIHWQRIGDAMPVKPKWVNDTQDFWAPHVSEHDGKFYMYFSGEGNQPEGKCLGAAVADQPEGPFIPQEKPMLCGDGFVNIDPMAFDDPQTGQRLLYWGSGFLNIKVRELTAGPAAF